MTEVLIAKPGEITLKTRKIRKRFENRLIENVKSAFSKSGIKAYSIKNMRGRFVIETKETKEAFETLKNVFGINQIEIAIKEEFHDLDDILKRGEELFKEKVKGKKFAVRVKRTGTHPFRSMDIERALGGRLYEYSAGVDLKNPETTVELEIVDQTVFYIVEKVRGAGGLPVGTEGRIHLLFSGGFDSSVAFYQLLKRGLEVDLISFLFGGEEQFKKIFEIARFIGNKFAHGYEPMLYIVDFYPVIMDIRENVKESYRNLILKRQMLRAAEELAKEKGFLAVATGDSIGQVASQTFDNLVVSSYAIEMPVIRPLVSFDKQEIVDISRAIGVYELVSSMKEYCQITPKHPVTRATLEATERQERNLDIELPRKLVNKRRSFYPTKVEGLEMLDYQLDLKEIPEDAVIFDIRDKEDFEEWHIPGAIHIDEAKLYEMIQELSKSVEDTHLPTSPHAQSAQGEIGGGSISSNDAELSGQAPPTLDRDRIYVVACYRGARSMAIVNEMRKHGLKAYSLKGGCEAYR